MTDEETLQAWRELPSDYKQFDELVLAFAKKIRPPSRPAAFVYKSGKFLRYMNNALHELPDGTHNLFTGR